MPANHPLPGGRLTFKPPIWTLIFKNPHQQQIPAEGTTARSKIQKLNSGRPCVFATIIWQPCTLIVNYYARLFWEILVWSDNRSSTSRYVRMKFSHSPLLGFSKDSTTYVAITSWRLTKNFIIGGSRQTYDPIFASFDMLRLTPDPVAEYGCNKVLGLSEITNLNL